MPSLSKLSDKCKKCHHVNDCDNKRMVACGMIELKPNVAESAASITMSVSQPMLRKQTPIIISMGEYGTINTSLEEMSEQLKKDLYRSLSIECAYGRR